MLRRKPFALLFVIIVCGGLAAQTGRFMDAPQYAVGSSPLGAAAGDLNGDGKLDLVVTNKVDETVSVLINKGDGTFKPQSAVDVGDVPAAVALADLNGDGHLDVVVVLPVWNESPGSRISVLLGHGDGTFQPYAMYNTQSNMSPQFLAVGDFNGDGKPDVVVTNTGTDLIPGNSVSVLLNDGTGAFPNHVEYGTGLEPLAVTVGDFNGDKKMDLAVANACGSDPLCAVSSVGTVSILLGNGNGTFQNSASFQAGYRPDAIVAVDLDGDKKLDLAVGNYNGNDVSVLIGQGNGSFKAQVKYGTAIWQPYGIVAADFNHDGKVDLAVSTSGSTAVSILMNKGGGKFLPHQDYWAGNGAGIPAVGDFNGDSYVDLAIPDLGWANRPDNKTTVLMGNGDGTFRTHALYETSVTPGAVAAADFNEDGIEDLVVGWDSTATDASNARIDVLLSNAHGTYDLSSYATGSMPASVAVGDFNGDAHMDIAVANYGTPGTPDSTIGILLGLGDGTFQPQVLYHVGKNPIGLIGTDINGDGILDLVVSNSGDTTPTAGVLLGNGDGTFQGQKTTALGGIATALAAKDLNADGHPDLVAVFPKTNQVATLIGNGDGTFKAPTQFPTGNSPLSLAVGDLNGDGKVDVMVANNVDGTLGVLLGKGDGSLQTQVPYTTSSLPASVAIGDFNGDSKLDLLVSSMYENTASLFFGKGDGTLASPVAYGTGWTPIALAISDLNHDGALDVVSANTAVRSVSMIMNAGGTFIGLTSSTKNPVYGDSIDFAATIAPSISWNLSSPTGTVSFLDGSKILGTANMSGGTASFSTTSLNAGKHNLSAAYSGDTLFQPHISSSVPQDVSVATSATSLGSSANPSSSSQAVTFSATVVPEVTGMPSGTVTFFDGTTQLGTGTLANGVASFTTTNLIVGTHSITATYIGDSNFSSSTSPAINQVVNLTDFGIAASDFAGPIKAGQSAKSTVTVTPANGFSAPVTFSCSAGMPSKSACSFNPATVTPTSGTASSTLTVSTTAPSSAVLKSAAQRKGTPIYAMLLPLSLFATLGVGFRTTLCRKLLQVLLAVLLLTGLSFQIACGGGGSSSTPTPPQVTPGTPAGTYTITISATSGSGASAITKTTQLKLIVQ